MCSKPATNPVLRYDLFSTFDIVVGSQQQRFTVHTNVLTHRSEFFRAARSSQWLTDPAKPVDLEDDDPEVLSAYLECVYFGIEAIKLDMECEDPDKPKLPNCDSEKQELMDTFEWSHGECQKRREQYLEQCPVRGTPYSTVCGTQILWLVKTYLQADKLQDCETANLIIDEIIRFSKAILRSPTYEVVRLVYETQCMAIRSVS